MNVKNRMLKISVAVAPAPATPKHRSPVAIVQLDSNARSSEVGCSPPASHLIRNVKFGGLKAGKSDSFLTFFGNL
jgi:hypothetical protein